MEMLCLSIHILGTFSQPDYRVIKIGLYKSILRNTMKFHYDTLINNLCENLHQQYYRALETVQMIAIIQDYYWDYSHISKDYYDSIKLCIFILLVWVSDSKKYCPRVQTLNVYAAHELVSCNVISNK